MIYYTYYDSPIGKLMISSDGDNLTGLWLENQKYYAATIKDDALENKELTIFKQTFAWLDKYFAKKSPKISELPLAPSGTNFRQEVWSILCEIPYGELLTYGDIADKIAKKRGKKTMSAQAVGGAVGHNPISIIIPCHRVVGSDGSLTGYAGGITNKIKLLELEGAKMNHLYKPSKGTAL